LIDQVGVDGVHEAGADLADGRAQLALRVSAPFGHVHCEVELLARDEAEAVLRAACWAQVHASPQWQDRARGPALAFVGASLGVMSRLAPGR